MLLAFTHFFVGQSQQEAQVMLTTGSTRLAVSRVQQTWYHFRSIATFR